MAHRTVPVMLLFALLTAGCVGAEDPTTAAAPDGSVETAATPDAAAPEDTPATPDAASGAVRTEPVDWSGTLPAYACVPFGPNSCMGYGLTSGTRWKDTGIANVTGGTLTLTWDAEFPLTQTLRLIVSAVESCGDGCYSSDGSYWHEVEGTSPLTLEIPAAELGDSATLFLSVDVPRQTPSPVFAKASTPQDFHVTGEILVPE